MIERFGVAGGVGEVKLPFAKAVRAGNTLYVSGQTPMRDGRIVIGNIQDQTKIVMENIVEIAKEAGFTMDECVMCNCWLDDGRDFNGFNAIFEEFIDLDNPPARACVVSPMVIDVRVEVQATFYKES